ncbi:hypothetical protein FACS189451_08750 [Bacteroidia bacterium]|nr:hypothetical protein FACS189451_08750 [Bacteroidia bacterium]
MELTKEEFDFFKLIHNEQEIGNPIAFREDDYAKVKEYQQKYGNVYALLHEKELIWGKIEVNNYLILSPVGEKLFPKIISEKEGKIEYKRSKIPLWQLIVAVISVIIAFICLALGIYK